VDALFYNSTFITFRVIVGQNIAAAWRLKETLITGDSNPMRKQMVGFGRSSYTKIITAFILYSFLFVLSQERGIPNPYRNK
jgi:hypothetical protein